MPVSPAFLKDELFKGPAELPGPLAERIPVQQRRDQTNIKKIKLGSFYGPWALSILPKRQDSAKKA